MRPPLPTWTEQGYGQTRRLQPGFPEHRFLCTMAWPMGHHEPPCRAHLVHATETDLEIIYRPELYRNHCVCCCCGNRDVEQALGLQGPRSPGKAVRFHPGSQPYGSRSPTGVTQERKVAFNGTSTGLACVPENSTTWVFSRRGAVGFCSQLLMKSPRTMSPSLAEHQSAEEPFKILAAHPRPATSGSLEGGTWASVFYFLN